MLHDGVQLTQGSKVVNLTVDNGAAFPATPDLGELFFRTDAQLLYIYDNTGWTPVATTINAGNLPGNTLAPNIIYSSLTTVGTLVSLNVTGAVTAASFSGSGASLTSIPNVALINSSLTIGSTTIALGATSTSLAGLVSVTSSSFVGALTGNADTASTASNLGGGLPGNIVYQSAAGTTSMLGTGTSSQVLVSGVTPSWTNTPTLTGTNFTGIPNGALTNSSVTIGSTTIALGATAGSLAGLTSVTATTFSGSFSGALSGNATSATNIAGGLAGNIPYQTGAGATAMLGTGTSSQVLVSGAIPGWTNAPTLTGTNFTGIPNGALTNNTVTIGSTVIALGETTTNLNGLTGVAATTFTGALVGNASTATTLQTARTINGVSFNGSANIVVPTIYDAAYKAIFNPGGGILTTLAPTFTGAIRVVLPTSTTAAFNITFKVTDSAGETSFDVRCGGYFDSTLNQWNGAFAYLVGNADADLQFTVRLGFNGTKPVIYVGELVTIWSAPQIFVTECLIGQAGQSVAYTTGWLVGFEATAFQGVTYTRLNPQVGYAFTENIPYSSAQRDAFGDFAARTITASLADVNGYRTVIPAGGYYYGAVAVSGAIAVHLPVFVAQEVSAVIKVHEQITGNSFEVHCGGAYDGTTWTGTFAYILGSSVSNRQFTVRFGGTGTGVIYIGELASAWDATLAAFVTEFLSTDGSTASANDWVVGLESVSFDNVTSTVTNPQVGYAQTGNTANSVVLRDASGNFSAGTITATQFSGSGAGLTNIPNGALSNSSITIGSTTIALGATALSLSGLTTVSTSTLVAGAGTVGAPAITIAGSLTTGLYSPVADTLAGVTAGAERWRTLATGETVFNGTTVYAATLTAISTATRSGGVGIRNSAGTAAGGVFTSAAGSGAGSTAVILEGAERVSIYAGTTPTERMRIGGAVNEGVGIGSTSLTARGLVVGNALTGATTAIGVAATSASASDVTGTHYGFYSEADTQAGSFTLTNLVHFGTIQGTIGAGSTVANQAGFYVGANLTGATNNYGFRGLIPAGTGRYNLYMDGTAGNYLAGPLGIGTTTTTNALLNIKSPGLGAAAISIEAQTGFEWIRRLSTGGSNGAIGTLFSSGATFLGYGVRADSTVTDGYVSSHSQANIGRAAIELNSGFFRVLTGTLQTSTDGGAVTMSEALRVDAAGSLGIGTTNPLRKLDVRSLTDGNAIRVTSAQDDSAHSTTVPYGSFEVYNADASNPGPGVKGAFQVYPLDATGFGGSAVVITAASGSTNNVEVMRLDGRTGGVGIGSGSNALIGRGLLVGNTLTGGGVSAYGVTLLSTIASDVTSVVHGFLSQPSTQAAVFTLANLSHFTVAPGAIGAGSVVTTQVGFSVTTGMVGATNNYGFRGSLAAGTGRYNLYMDGTAVNYLAGSLGVGTSSPLTTLDVRSVSGITSSRDQQVVGAGLQLGILNFSSRYDATVYATGAAIQAISEAAWTSTSWPTYLRFSTVASGSATLVEAMRIAASGGVGIGSTALTARGLVVGNALTGSTTGVSVYAINTFQSDVTINGYGFLTDLSTAAAAAYTLSNLPHYTARQSTIGAGSTVTIQTGFLATSSLTGATNNYGFRGQIAAGTGRYNLYMDGTADNYLAGPLGIGTTSLTARGLVVGNALTGGTAAYGILASNTFTADVTLIAGGFQTSLSTAASTFTVASLYHYAASQGTFGVGSTVTGQQGFYVSSNLTGATNNYAFRSQIAAGTGRWNLYMDGTADNYLAGNLGVGITSPNVGSFSKAISINRSSGSSSGLEFLLAGSVEGSVFTRSDGNAGLNLSTVSTRPIVFSPNNIEAMRVTGAGLIAIGSGTGDSTYSKGAVSDLSVAKSTAWATISARAYSVGAASGGLVVLGKSRSATVGTLAETLNNDTLGIISAEGVRIDSTNRWAAAVVFEQEGAAGAVYIPGRIVLKTGTSTAEVTEKFRLANDGTTTLGGSNTTPAFKVGIVSGQVNWLRANSSTTGNTPYLLAEGSDLNVSLGLITKGSGSHLFYTGTSTLQVAIMHTVGATNYLKFTGSNAGAPKIDTSAGSLQLAAAGVVGATLDPLGNLGLAATPSAWNADYRALQIGSHGAAIYGRISTNELGLVANTYRDAGGVYRYTTSNFALRHLVDGSSGNWYWDTAPSGTAGNTVTFTNAMLLNVAGNLGLGTSPVAWSSTCKVLQIGANGGALYSSSDLGSDVVMSSNAYKDSGGIDRLLVAGAAARIVTVGGAGNQIYLQYAAGGLAGDAISWTSALSVGAGGATVSSIGAFYGALVDNNNPGHRVLLPVGGSLTGSVTTTGAIAVTNWQFNSTGAGKNGLTIRVEDTVSGDSFDVRCGGVYDTTAGWTATYAYIIAPALANKQFTVRFGTYLGDPTIFIGELSTTWDTSISVFVLDVVGTNLANMMAHDWSIHIEPTSFGTVDSTLTATQVGLGFKPINSQSAAYTTVLADSLRTILHPSADTTARTFTIDSNANVPYPPGTELNFVNQNGAGVVTIAITTDTMRLAGAGTTGSRTLAANGVATARKITATEWIISGVGLT